MMTTLKFNMYDLMFEVTVTVKWAMKNITVEIHDLYFLLRLRELCNWKYSMKYNIFIYLLVLLCSSATQRSIYEKDIAKK